MTARETVMALIREESEKAERYFDAPTPENFRAFTESQGKVTNAMMSAEFPEN